MKNRAPRAQTGAPLPGCGLMAIVPFMKKMKPGGARSSPPARPGHRPPLIAGLALAVTLVTLALAPAAVFRAAPLLAQDTAARNPAGEAGGVKADQDPVLARVNRREIRLSHVYKEIEALSLGDQIDVRSQIERFTDSIITEEALFQSVLGSDFAGEEELRAKIKGLVVEHLIATRVREKINVTDENIRAYYAQNRDFVRGLHVRVRQILLKTRPRCVAARERIKAPGDFGREARAHSLDEASAGNGGEVGLMMPVAGPNSLGFEMELFTMAVGEMRIFDSRQGCHLVQVTEIIDPPDPPFEQVRAFVLPILRQEQEQRLLQELIQKATRAVRVERLPPSTAQ